MAENLLARSPWYPNPWAPHGRQDYIYLNTLQKDHSQVYHAAKNRLFDTLSNINTELEPQLNDLLNLAEREQKKEDEMLDKVFGVSTGTPREDGARIKAFNKLYQHMPIFERNLKKIKEVGLGSNQGRIDITASFRGYLETEIKTFFKEVEQSGKWFEINKNNLMEVTKRALVRALSSRDEVYGKDTPEDQIRRSYQELAYVVEQMENNDPFIEEVFQLYFGTSLDKLTKKSNGKKQKTKKGSDVISMISNAKGIHGNLQEYMLALINDAIPKEINVSSMTKTGSSGQKADLINLFEASFKLPTELIDGEKEDGSVREMFIKRYEDFYQTLKGQTGNIVEISSKNYNLTSTFFKENGGFTAQSNITIENLRKMLNAYGYNKKRTDDLIFALTNIGPDTLGQGTEIVSHSLSMLIGYFLFDDIDMDINLNVQAIHLFNLDGIYMPLSCFLLAAYDTLKEFETLSRDMVSVHYTPKSVNYQKATGEGEDVLNKQRWEDIATKKQSQTELSIHFFKEFPKYIAQRYGSLTS